jgi:hypothetical protein
VASRMWVGSRTVTLPSWSIGQTAAHTGCASFSAPHAEPAGHAGQPLGALPGVARPAQHHRRRPAVTPGGSPPRARRRRVPDVLGSRRARIRRTAGRAGGRCGCAVRRRGSSQPVRLRLLSAYLPRPSAAIDPHAPGESSEVWWVRRPRSRLMAALMRPTWLKAWGKLPSSSPLTGLIPSASRPRSLV